MKKLNDYSGQFLPDLKIGDFSASALEKLLGLYSQLYSAVDGFWYLVVKERWSNDAALDCDLWVWDRMAKYEMKNITKQLNIQGRDITALMKAIQLSPWSWRADIKIDIENQNSAVYSVIRCKVLEYMEKEGEGREYQICHIVEPRLLSCYASFFNPNIEVKCLKVPPREDQEGPCCQWRFTLNE